MPDPGTVADAHDRNAAKRHSRQTRPSVLIRSDLDSPTISRVGSRLMIHVRRDTAVGITLALVILVGFVMGSAHMLIDGNCDTVNTGFVGPDPNDAKACARTGGTWTQSTGFMHVAYEIGHTGFWPLIALLAIAATSLVICVRASNPGVGTLSL
jgi:hypothetical protein